MKSNFYQVPTSSEPNPETTLNAMIGAEASLNQSFRGATLSYLLPRLD
uniref:Uncharacterized protein n=1 Tax=Nelumbo nucifera TaxID=4432 RepID=A0A822ZW27_NELNU|nr:TPA_asm: hypothetical protein HUJ06_019024 [Nelumbo nucifera]